MGIEVDGRFRASSFETLESVVFAERWDVVDLDVENVY